MDKEMVSWQTYNGTQALSTLSSQTPWPNPKWAISLRNPFVRRLCVNDHVDWPRRSSGPCEGIAAVMVERKPLTGFKPISVGANLKEPRGPPQDHTTAGTGYLIKVGQLLQCVTVHTEETHNYAFIMSEGGESNTFSTETLHDMEPLIETAVCLH